MSKKVQRVLLFNTIYPQKTGGMEVYNYHLSSNLLVDKYPDIILLLTDSTRVDNKRIFRINSRLFGVTRWGMGMFSVLLSCLFSPYIHMRKWETVMIPYTSNFEYSAWPLLAFSKLFGFKYVIHCHGGSVRDWKTGGLQARFFKRATRVAAVSQKIIVEYGKRTGCNIEYLPPLMDFQKSILTKEGAKKQFGLEKYDKIILYVGGLKPLKSPETLIKAFVSLPKGFVEEKNVGLVMAGSGELLIELQTKYASTQNVNILGAIKNESIKDLYAAADVYVISSWFEGTPLALMEAMFNGICCIGTKVHGIDAIISNGENGLLFPKDDDKALNELLKMTLENDVLVRQLGQAAQDYYKTHYSYEDHIKQVLDLLDYSNN